MSITKIEPNLVNASANFTFNNVTATGNLSSLNANLGNLAQANYFSGSGANLTNLPAGNISGQVGNALISGTVYTASQPNITSVGTLTGLTSTGTINLTGASNVALGPVGNVRITGGSNGQYLQTDGSGILSWSTVASGSTSNISNGNSNVNIPSSNGNVNISAVGNANILVITGTGANITGTLNVTGNTTVGNLTTSGSGGNVSNVNVISANTFIATGNITSGNANLGNAVTANFFIGSGNNLSNIQGANVTGTVSSATTASTVTTASQPNITSVGTLSSLSATGNITSGNANLGNLVTANFFTGNGSLLTGITVSAGNTIVSGNSNVLVSANGNVTTSVSGNANILVITGTGVNVAGTLNVTGNATVGNLITAGSGGNISNVNVISANTFIATGNITAGNINTTGSGGNIGNANVISANTFIASGNITTSNANLGNAATANYFIGNLYGTANLATYATTANAVAGANVSGQVANALVASTVYTNAQPNITSVGTLTSITVSGTSNLGPVGNVTITGGTNGQYLQTNGSGVLSWANVASGSTSNISNGNSNVNIPSANGNVNISAVGNANILVVTGTGANISGTLNVTGNATVGNIVTSGSGGNVSNVNVISANTFIASGNITAGNINTTGSGGNIGNANVISANTFIASGNITAGNANLGNSVTANFFIGSGANLTSLPAGNVSGQVANALVSGTVYTAAQPNITSVGTLTGITSTGTANLIGASNVSLGPVGNVKITGGSNGQYLQTDGSGTLTWSTVSSGAASNISNGNSNVNIPSANGNINFTAVGNTNMVITGTGVNVAGTLNVTGNATVGNLITAGSGGNVSNVNVISANTFIASGNITAGNINTTGSGGNIGNANVISANTFIATGNITVSNANLGNAATANYFIGNLYGTANLATYATTANAVAGGNVSGQVANALVAGTVYTNAQPNITSVGTLTSLGVTGNITSGNANLGNLVTANFFSGNGSLLTGITVSAGNSIVNGNSNVLVSANGNVTTSVAGNANILIVTGTGANIAGTLNVTGNATIGNIVTSGSGGNVSNVNVISANTFTASGNITASNANLGNSVTANYFTGNLYGTANLSTFATTANSVAGANVSGQVGNSLVAGTVYTNAQPNITSVGTLTDLSVSGNGVFGGNLTVNGTLTYINSTTLSISDPIINLQTGANGAVPVANTGKDVGTALNYYDTSAKIAWIGWDVSNAEIAFGSNVGISSEVVTFTSLANIRSGNASLGNNVTANFFIGDGSMLTGITTAGSSNGNSNVNIPAANGNVNISAVGNANILVVTGTGVNVAGTLNVTGNITAGNINTTGSGGNISNVNVISANTFIASGNITSGNANLGNLATANFFTGNGSQLSALTFGNITTFTTAGLSTDKLYLQGTTRLNVTASGSSGYIFDQYGATVNPALYVTSGQTLAFNLNVSGHPFLIQTSGGANYSTGLEHVDSTGTVLSAGSAQGQISGTLYWKVPYGITGNYKYICSIHGGMNGNIVVTDANVANITVGLATYATTANAVAGANVSGQVGNALIADTVYTAAQPNITSVGTLTSLAVTGNITSGNANLGNAVTANYFIGDGSMLTGITGGGGTPGGANTYIQFNDGSVFAGNAGLTFNKTNTVLTANNLVVTATTNLGAVSNITVTGGVGGQVLGTNGNNILSWITPATTSITSTTGITVDTFTGDGSTVVFTLSVTPATITQTQVNYNGVLQLRSAYTLTGSTIIFSTAPISGSLIEITTTQGVSATSGSYGVRSYTGTGSLTTFTVTNGSTTSSVLVTENGVLQTPTTDYTVSGTVLTFTTAPANGVSIQIRELGIFVVNTTSPTTTDILSPFLLMGA